MVDLMGLEGLLNLLLLQQPGLADFEELMNLDLPQV